MKLTKLNENKTLAEYEKEWEEQNGKTCDNCGTKLNDGGTCPKCDDGEEDSLKEGVSGTNSEEFDSYAAAIERHKANGTEKELDAVITSAYNDLNRETRLTGPEFNKLCDLANLPDRKIAVREAYDPQEFNPDATGPIYDMNVQFYNSLEKAIKEERWEDAAKEYCEIKADLDQELQNADRKPIMGKLFKLFAKPHLRTLDNYKRRIPAEYLNDCDKKNENLTEATIDKFYIDEIISAQGDKTETERHSFDTIEELKQYVKDANLTPEDIENCGKCEIKDLFESGTPMSKEEDEESGNEFRSTLPKDTPDSEASNKVVKWLTDNGYLATNEALGVGAGLALGGAAIGAGMVGSSLLDSMENEDDDAEELKELLDIEIDAKGFGGSGNNVHVGPGSMPLTASLDRDKEEKHTRHYGKDYDDEFTLMGY